MTVRTVDAAKYICKKGGWNVSNLAAQRLLYIGHMLSLGRDQGPLIGVPFEAWDYGPVVPKLYHRAKAFGSKSLPDIFHDARDISEAPESEILDEVCNALLGKRPGELVAITHWPKGAWATHYAPGIRGIKIPNEDIAKEYHDRIQG